MTAPIDRELTQRLGGRRIFVTGGAGFIGSHLVKILADAGSRVTVYDNLSSARPQWDQHAGKAQLLRGDLLDLDKLKRSLEGQELVFHLAANGDIRRGFEETDLDLRQSVDGARNLLEAMRWTGVRELLFSSSGSVYGDAAVSPTPETAGPLHPLSLYAAAKIAAEAYISAFCSLFGLRAWIFRFGNVVGPGMSRGVIYDLIQKLRLDPSSLEVLGDGTQDKPYFMVEDCIYGMLTAYARWPLHEEKPCEVFNLGTHSTSRVSAIADVVVQEMGLQDVRICYRGGRAGWPGDQTRVQLSTQKIESLGWKASRSSDEAVRETARLLIRETAA